MKITILACSTVLLLGLGSGGALAKNLPAGGLTVGEIASWLQNDGYKAQVQTAKDGSQNVYSASDGVGFHIYPYDCKNKRCGSFEFSAGFDTKGALSPQKINEWNKKTRWVRSYVDDVNDPWLEYDVDLTPGGTYDLLDDEFALWRDRISKFQAFIK
jgi:hypothetical protein